jgi:hypothetical protein
MYNQYQKFKTGSPASLEQNLPKLQKESVEQELIFTLYVLHQLEEAQTWKETPFEIDEEFFRTDFLPYKKQHFDDVYQGLL